MNEIRKEILDQLFNEFDKLEMEYKSISDDNEFLESYKQGQNIGQRIGITTAIQIIRNSLDI